MKNVLFIHQYVGLGGGETSLLNLMSELRRSSEYQPILLCPQYGQLTKRAIYKGIKVYVFSFGLINKAWIKFIPIFSLLSSLRLFHLIKKEKISIVHSYTTKGVVVAGLITKLLHIPLIWTSHLPGENIKGLRAIVMKYLVCKALCVSKYVYDSVALPASKKKVRHLGVNINDYVKGYRKKIRREMLMNNGYLLIGMIGRFQSVKGHKYFVKAAKKLVQKYKNLKFIVVGNCMLDGSSKDLVYKRETLKLVQDLKLKKYFIFTGFRSDISDLLAGIDILVVPSISESFSMIILEALAAGLPIVATDRGGPSEIIQDGENGLLFKSQDFADLARKLEKLILDTELRKNICEKAPLRAEEFSVTKYVNQLTSIYKKFLK